jgi:hypothetical protein
MAIHPVRQSHRRNVLPYIVTGRQLPRQWFYRVHAIFGYTTDIVVALATVGVASPLLAVLGGQSPHKDGPSPTLGLALSSVPLWLVFPTMLFLAAWIVLRVAFAREEGQKRAVLAKSCFRVLREAQASLHSVLSKPDPMPGLTELLEAKIRPTVDRSIQEGAWLWLPFADNIATEVDKLLETLCNLYEEQWLPVEAPAMRKADPGDHS